MSGQLTHNGVVYRYITVELPKLMRVTSLFLFHFVCNYSTVGLLTVNSVSHIDEVHRWILAIFYTRLADMKLQGKVAIVTGGAQGLGRGFAEGLLRKGAKVCICDINPATGKATLDSWNRQFGRGQSMFLRCDVSNHEQFEGVIKKVIEEFGGVDILVNNAGVSGEDPQTWRRTIQINMIGVIEGTMLASTYMDRTAGGRGGLVVNIASTAGLTPIFYSPVYSGSKYGVVGYTRSMAVSYLW
ncbi:15-hydroxyprostaglandin dehydrogenase [NAD(+)]-like [Argopecten irradians]|uniref:15-hydroxyprostaglandin dehydrogenase [NAD(+)]-like n=1 Tax=Argopecten irradians TaxID=31199 RepID=UPI00371F93B0